MSRTTSAQVLAKTDICRGLTDGEAQTIFNLSEEVVLPPNQAVFTEGGSGDAVFIVVVGEVEVLKRDHAGNDRSLAKVGPGAVIGEMSLINGRTLRSATARTLSATTLLKIPSDAFHKLLTDSSVAALKMVHNFAQVMSKRLALVDERVVNLLQQAEGGRHEELGDFQKLLNKWSF
jgi:CRP/FNR family transcriptional regulator/CRP/FNR family cyclic AMP-dependent transcriptional regulator